MKKFFRTYECLAPLILTPLTFWLWWQIAIGELMVMFAAWALPIIFPYIVPGVGTNILGVWEIHPKHRVGRFRAHHGFVFGSVSSLFAWLVYQTPITTISEMLVYAFLLATTLAFWNIIYEIAAVKSGYISIYNQLWADGKEAEAIVHDYTPIYFGGFGFFYGIAIAAAVLLSEIREWEILSAVGFVVLSVTVSIAFPVLWYRNRSFKKHGHGGCRPVKKHA